MTDQLFNQNVTSMNVVEVRDLIQRQLEGKEFIFVETKFGDIHPPLVKRGLRLKGKVESWGKFANEGFSGFRIATADSSHDYNSHSSGLVSVDAKIEEGIISVSFYDHGVPVHHQYVVC